MVFAETTWLFWVYRTVGIVWLGFSGVALLGWVIRDTRNNWEHGNTGAFGYFHTLSRLPLAVAYSLVAAPLGLLDIVAAIVWVWGCWRNQ